MSLKSPCIGICKFERVTGLCKACFRTRPEKRDWKRLPETAQGDILALRPDRERALAALRDAAVTPLQARDGRRADGGAEQIEKKRAKRADERAKADEKREKKKGEKKKGEKRERKRQVDPRDERQAGDERKKKRKSKKAKKARKSEKALKSAKRR